ncbi:hypothetical protein QAD02_021496 [Eretmocerus hayati]|uniref:Uncharacterized protein n=1 Tax=Eretmocerus hayati TaxID=131215 RepID=A0ACC2PQF6_9HYME|nr:hypothetical protein QAD02_021496 [Eretmocerus hayati]
MRGEEDLMCAAGNMAEQEDTRVYSDTAESSEAPHTNFAEHHVHVCSEDTSTVSTCDHVMQEEGDLATVQEGIMIQDGSPRYPDPAGHTEQMYSDVSDDDDAIQPAKSQSCVTKAAVAGPSHLQTLAEAVPCPRILDDVMLNTPLDLDKLRKKQIDSIESINEEVGHDSSRPSNSSQGNEETEYLILIPANNTVASVAKPSIKNIYNCLHSFILNNLLYLISIRMLQKNGTPSKFRNRDTKLLVENKI